ncbi:MAG TPA: diguanylate phosphodiesterase [Syntrophobacteraceae bacterium]|nr:diguanylate phosphodiesterase [Syntrophobacteraceae bacterium]
MGIITTRQPIFDRKQEVVGYEVCCAIRSDRLFAFENEIGNTLLLIGLNRLTGGKRAFVPVMGEMLLNDDSLSLPELSIVIEILKCLDPVDILIDACAKLKSAGYTLALGDFVIRKNLSSLFDLADIIKIDIAGLTIEEERALIDNRPNGSIKFLAARVETMEQFEDSFKAGFDLFQGYFFSEPIVVSGREIPGYKLNHLRVLNEVNRKDIEFGDLDKIIRQDVTLSYKLLNFINSAFFGLRYNVSSIRHALDLLGEREIKRWASLVILCDIGKDKPLELLAASLVRANLCEAFAPQVGLEAKSSELFLMGLFSLVDILVGRTMKDIMDEMPLATDIKSALCGEDNKFRKLLNLVLHYERGDFESFLRYASEMDINLGTVTDHYLASVERAEEALQLYGPQKVSLGAFRGN